MLASFVKDFVGYVQGRMTSAYKGFVPCSRIEYSPLLLYPQKSIPHERFSSRWFSVLFHQNSHEVVGGYGGRCKWGGSKMCWVLEGEWCG